MKLNTKTKYALLAFLLVTAAAGGWGLLSAEESGQSVDQLTAQKDAKRRELLEIRQRISALQADINVQRSKIASLRNEIRLSELQIEQTQSQIHALTTEIDVTNLDIVDTINQITQAEEDIQKKLDLLENLIQEIYKNDGASALKIILTKDNFSDVLNQMQQTVFFEGKNQELLAELQNLRRDLASKQNLLEDKKKELNELKAQAEATEASLLAQQAQKTNLLSYTRGQESRYQSLLSDVSEEEARVNREVFDLDLAIRQKLGDKSLPPVAGSLTWPMDGILTQGYGNTGFRSLGYTFHNGIDLAAPANTPIHSAGDGIVYATGTGKTAYGNWAVLKHTLKTDSGMKNVYTLYAHLSKISVSSGQGILQGDLVGLEGNTGNTTRLLYGPERGYHLHFAIFDEEGFGIKDGAYADIYGAYRIPYGYTYNPMEFLK